MGCAQSAHEQTTEHRQIEKELKEQSKAYSSEIRVLLLGAGDTGKSTLVKQMKLLYKAGFTPHEREIFRDVVATNILVWMHALVSGVQKMGLHWNSDENRKTADEMLKNIANQTLPCVEERFMILVKSREGFISLWNDPAIQEAFTNSDAFKVSESARFFFDQLPRIATDDYIPTDEDILLSRARTNGIVETTFQNQGQAFRVIDVGGQRSERSKWIHCFENVTAVIFFAALSEYNLSLYEERNVNRMSESLKLFGETLGSHWFQQSAIVLFLNKSDLFREKLGKYPLSNVYPEYQGGADFEEGCKFMKKLYLSLNTDPNRPVYTHITCCTDTEQIRNLMNDLRDVFLRAALCLL